MSQGDTKDNENIPPSPGPSHQGRGIKERPPASKRGRCETPIKGGELRKGPLHRRGREGSPLSPLWERVRVRGIFR